MAKCRAKIAHSDDEGVSYERVLKRTLPLELFNSKVNVHGAFLIPNLASPRPNDEIPKSSGNDIAPEKDRSPKGSPNKDGEQSPKSPTTPTTPTRVSTGSVSADKKVNKSLSGRMSKIFGLGKTESKKPSPRDKGKHNKEPKRRNSKKKDLSEVDEESLTEEYATLCSP